MKGSVRGTIPGTSSRLMMTRRTEFLVISSPRAAISNDLKMSIGQDFISPTQSCKSLGVVFDRNFNMEDQINNVREVCFSI